MDLRRNLLRLLALGALVAALIVVVIVVTTSLPDSDDGNGDRRGQQRAQEEEEGSGDKYYFVQPGDSLSTIAEEEGIELERLEQLNPELDPQALSTGQRVRLR
jgi:LysM repeat protein